ncbi:S1C family serine protease [Pelagibacteraceae bacterium]|nr:S1C family serine protease [Pelagibacteraceae bacterium]
MIVIVKRIGAISMKKIILFLFLLQFTSTHLHAITADNYMAKFLQTLKIDEVIADLDLLESIFRTNTLKFRGSSKDNFFTKNAESVVAIYTDSGMGSGAIINKDGFIVTNYHVIGDNKKVRVVFKPKNGVKAVPTSIHEADVISIDPTRDLALVKPLFPPKNFKPISFPKNFKFNDNLVSEEAHCIGHPDGYTWTYTKGVISQIRPFNQWTYYTDKLNTDPETLSEDEIEDEYKKSIIHIADVIQIDCEINPGNSGGPLMNQNGELLGINSFSDQGIYYFAVAFNEVQEFLNGEIMEPISSFDKYHLTKEPRKIDEGDENNDGIIDWEQWDMTGNFIIDTVKVNEDNDMKTGFENGFDYFLVDNDENGSIDILYFEENNAQFFKFDIDQDGIFDVLRIDYDGDGNIDQTDIL